VLRVCADPNNLPFSNEAGEGFENKLAEMMGRALGANVEYVWWTQRRGFVRNTLKVGQCDVVMGVPSDYGMTLNTRPYYRSTYVFVHRKGQAEGLRSITDPRLSELRLGVHAIGADNPPPAIALARQGVTQNVRGYSIYGDYRMPNPPARLIEAVARGDIDVAIAWGPTAGYFAQRLNGLIVTPIAEQQAGALPFQFSMAMGVRKGDRERKARLDAALDRLQPEIDALLQRYGVPLVAMPARVAEHRPASDSKP
jgi:mxaJ protein